MDNPRENGFDHLEKLLKKVDLEPRVLDLPFKNLSCGQKLRIRILCTVLQCRPILLCDEITSGKFLSCYKYGGVFY